ncbi:MAG: hypothetical protein WBQ50_06745, partial [Nocardioides sp.]
MSAQPNRPNDLEHQHDEADEDSPVCAEEAVVVRRSAVVAALVGGAASSVAIAYLWRAVQSGSGLDAMFCLLLAGVAGLHISSLLDART